MTYQVHTKETASEGSKKQLDMVQEKYGFVPNLLAVMASSEVVPEAYLTIAEIFGRSSFTPTEQQVILLTASYYNNCHYCVAAHTTIAGMHGVADNVVQSIRDGVAINDNKLEVLKLYTKDMVEKNGCPSPEATKNFFDAGFTKAQSLEVVLGLAFKTLSNYVNHIADTPLDDAFASAIWKKNAA